MNALERLTQVMDIVTAGNLETGHTVGWTISPVTAEGTLIISGDRLEEGLGWKNIEGKCRALETAFREQLHLPKETAREAGVRSAEHKRKIVLPEAALERLGGLTNIQADIVGSNIRNHESVQKAFQDKPRASEIS